MDAKNSGNNVDEMCYHTSHKKLCSHTIAISIKLGSIKTLLKWYRTLKHKTSFTTLCESGKPTSMGGKTRRKGVPTKDAANIKKLLSMQRSQDFSEPSSQDVEVSDSISISFETNNTSSAQSSTFLVLLLVAHQC